jgi:lipopolysaccharide biosynthesis regulator YciM
MALQAQARNQDVEAAALLAEARQVAPQAARAHVLGGQMLARQGQPAAAMAAFAELLVVNPAAFSLVASDYAEAAQAAGCPEQALPLLTAQYQRAPSMQLLQAIARLEPASGLQRQRLTRHLRVQPSLSAARELLTQSQNLLSAEEAPLVNAAIDLALRPLQRYRCAACGFEAQHYFWQCPGCLTWDSYPPRHVEEL